jgi:hypothetical protein
MYEYRVQSGVLEFLAILQVVILERVRLVVIASPVNSGASTVNQVMISTADVSSAMARRKSDCISQLPNELLIQILQSVPSNYNEQCKAFSAMSMVSRHFRTVVTPLLYRNFQDCCARHLQLFGQTVLFDKTRAELVKQYEGRRAGHVFNDSPQDCPIAWNAFALDDALEKTVRERLPSIPIPITRAVFSYALACVLPGLQQLDVTNGGNALLQHLSGLNVQSTAPFQQLHTLSITIEPDRAYRMHDVSLLFMLPSLKVLSIDMAALNDEEVQSNEPVHTLWCCSQRSSTVQKLTLQRCGLPASWIAEVILSCQILRRFHHEHYYWDNNTNYYPHIVQALTTHQETLTDVRLTELNGCKVDSVHQSDPRTPISFRQFISLTHLDIPLFSFATRTHHCAIDVLLPNSLHVLTVDVRSAREGFSDGFFILLAEAAPTHLPEMRSVEIICRIEDYREEGFLPLHFCHLRRMFQSYGVELAYFLEFVQCEFKAGKATFFLLSFHY